MRQSTDFTLLCGPMCRWAGSLAHFDTCSNKNVGRRERKTSFLVSKQAQDKRKEAQKQPVPRGANKETRCQARVPSRVRWRGRRCEEMMCDLLADDFCDEIGDDGDADGDVYVGGSGDDQVWNAAQPVAAQPDATKPAPLEESHLTRDMRVHGPLDGPPPHLRRRA